MNFKKLSIVVLIFTSLICLFLLIRSFDEPLKTYNSIDYALVDIEGGTFLMGSLQNEEDRFEDECQHQVTVESFQIGKYEVTQKQWKSVMGSIPSGIKGCDDCPVMNVSWNDVQQFIRKLNKKSSVKYRLPTEEEWEFAARGGTRCRDYKYSGGNTLNNVGWNESNSGGNTHSVGEKTPNELGLYDMSGNVNEWCQNWLISYPDCIGNNLTGSKRVFRGGSFVSEPQYCRVEVRYCESPDNRYLFLGFRLARTK